MPGQHEDHRQRNHAVQRGKHGGYPAGGSAVDATSVLVDTYLRDAPECPVAALTYTLDNGTPPRAECPYVADPHTY